IIGFMVISNLSAIVYKCQESWRLLLSVSRRISSKIGAYATVNSLFRSRSPVAHNSCNLPKETSSPTMTASQYHRADEASPASQATSGDHQTSLGDRSYNSHLPNV